MRFAIFTTAAACAGMVCGAAYGNEFPKPTKPTVIATQTLSAVESNKNSARRRIVKPSPAVAAAMARPKAGTFDASAWAFRDAAMLNARAFNQVASALDTDAHSAIDAGLGPPTSTSLTAARQIFFQGAIVLPGPVKGDYATAAYFNPIYDGVVAVKWQRTPRGWMPRSVVVATGARARQEASTNAPPWILSHDPSLADALTATAAPAAEQVIAVANRPPDDAFALADAKLMMARIAELSAAVVKGTADVPTQQRLANLFVQIQSGSTKGLRDAGVERRAAEQIGRLPNALRRAVVCFGAVPTHDGHIFACGPIMHPGIVFLVGTSQNKQKIVLTPVAISVKNRERS